MWQKLLSDDTAGNLTPSEIIHVRQNILITSKAGNVTISASLYVCENLLSVDTGDNITRSHMSLFIRNTHVHIQNTKRTGNLYFMR